MKKIKILDLDLELVEIEDPNARYDEFLVFETSLQKDEFIKFRKYVIEKNDDYFECEIEGAKIIARFGNVSHSVTSNSYLVRGPIIEKRNINLDANRWHENDFERNMIKGNLKNEIIIERLIEVLLDKKMFTKEEVDKLTDITNDQLYARFFDKRTF